MIIETYYMANAFVIELKGELDKFCRLDKLMHEIADGANSQAIFIDLKDVVFIGSGFINFLFAIRRMKPELSQKIRLARPNAQIQELLNLMRISELYPVCSSEFNPAAVQTGV